MASAIGNATGLSGLILSVVTEQLSYKLDKKGFPSELTFSQIQSDPKLFDVIIAGNGKKVHARSILAAENSEYMVPHFRFIVTDAK